MEFIAHLNLAEHGTSSSDETDKSTVTTQKSRPQAYKSCWRVLRQSGGAQLEMGLASSLAVAGGFARC
ncbi:hypothetical protein MTP99_003658 [Tenebrio molitor]|nr:hypothetical protein MTP99_003658 [Tenebrio molitor]